MAQTFTVIPKDKVFAVCVGSDVLQTPEKRPLLVPTKALAEAIASEWQANGKYSANKMILTSLAYTAIDRIEVHKEAIIEALMVYIDTDTLSYRATGSEALAKQQKEQWDPLLAWAGKLLGATWQVTAGVMPVEQPEAVHKAFEKRLKTLDAMRLAAACLLASSLSSLILALAVLERKIDAKEAFRLSRLEEESQAEAWGRDAEADARAERIKGEIIAGTRFLGLLEAP